ncbi:MAG: hypothetical protein SH859_06700 [Hyphomicrobium aestuarii]|nr:hypothetical protein [Hyphomicrobium aestuarii]
MTAFDLLLARPGPQVLAARPAAAFAHGSDFVISPAEFRPLAIASDGKAIIATSNRTVRKRMDKLARKTVPTSWFTLGRETRIHQLESILNLVTWEMLRA